MMLKSDIEVIKNVKEELIKEGFAILGVFGSQARGDARADSDIDILYRLDAPMFLSKYGGFMAYARIDEIREILKSRLKKEVDLADIDTLNEIGKKYILKDLAII